MSVLLWGLKDQFYEKSSPTSKTHKYFSVQMLLFEEN